MTVDGTYFRISEPIPFDKIWYSHKFKSAGLRYELGICIKTGDIFSFNGPFAASFSDLNIFRVGMKMNLMGGEQVIADRGYNGDVKVITPYSDPTNKTHLKMMGISRARHETINGRLKGWGILGENFRHNIDQHNLIFKFILVIEQIKIESGSPPFQVNYINKALV